MNTESNMRHFIFIVLVKFWNFYPFKNSLSYLIKRNNWLKEKLYKDLRYTGIMEIEIDNKKLKLFNPGITTIENEIYWKGLNNGWEKISLRIWQQLATHSNVIIDIGANSGLYSFVAYACNPNAEIFAFEPAQRTVEIFKKNLSLNVESKIKLIQKAVSNKTGKSLFYDLPTDTQYGASLNEKMLENFKNRVSYEVEVVSLDTFNELFGKKIDLLKIDVEMHEPEAIEGMIKIIERDKPAILIEILNDDMGSRIESQISKFDYNYYTIDEINLPKKVNKLVKSECYNFLLCNKQIATKLGLMT